MGRAIIITLDFDTPGNPGSLSAAYATGVFEIITEAVRKHFAPGNAECLRDCFRRLDEEFQEYITLDEVSADCFNLFVQACEAGLAEYESTGMTAWGVQHEPVRVRGIAWEWSELIKKLHADPRYRPVASVVPATAAVRP